MTRAREVSAEHCSAADCNHDVTDLGYSHSCVGRAHARPRIAAWETMSPTVSVRVSAEHMLAAEMGLLSQ
jgi:hypothetical protein